MYRATLNNRVRVFRQFFDEEGLGTDLTTPTLTVTFEDGTVLASPSVTPQSELGEGWYSADLTPADHTDQLGMLTLTWAGSSGAFEQSVSQKLEVVGSRYFSIGELRNMDGIGSSSKFPHYLLELALAETEATIEDYCKMSFTRRRYTDVFDSCSYHNQYGLFLRKRPAHEILAITLDDTAVDTTTWKVNRLGQARTTEGFHGGSQPFDDLVVTYVYGEENMPPDLRWAALRYARHLVLTNISTVPDRSRIMQTEFGLFVLDHPGDDKATGLPEVDAVFNRYREVDPGSFA